MSDKVFLIGYLTKEIESHRCFNHQFFKHFSRSKPSAQVVGAIFFQICHFYDFTRPGMNFPGELERIGMNESALLIKEIVRTGYNSDQLIRMAGYIINRASGKLVCPNLNDRIAVENTMKNFSDQVFGETIGYNQETGLIGEVSAVKALFDLRLSTDPIITVQNLGVTMAFEIIANRFIMPGAIYCLVGSGLYDVSLKDLEMEYLVSPQGDDIHDKKIVEAVETMITDENAASLRTGAIRLLDTLTNMFDRLESVL
mgnify:CR=1 FL=1